MSTYGELTDGTGRPQEIRERGPALLDNPLLNKGTAFTLAERDALGLRGLLPPRVCSLEEQKARAYGNYCEQPTHLHRHLWLRLLQDRNETLFYALLNDHLEEMMPIVYTPTVGEACQRLSHLHQNARGLYLCPDDVEHLEDIFQHLPADDVRLIVATDSEAILGLGDQGAGGMGIPIGKISLYVAGAGVPPEQTLPICLDVGTNNEELRNDPLYLGVDRPRMEGEEYFGFLDAFVAAVQRHLPEAVVQWEDFSKDKAFAVLERYSDKVISFNDDIQGTAAMVLGGILNAAALTGRSLADQTFVILGAGAAGIGIAQLLQTALTRAGLSEGESRARLWLLDSRGLLLDDRETMEGFKRPFACPRAAIAEWSVQDPQRITLEEVVAHVRPSVLVGSSGQPNTITEEMVKVMSAAHTRPVVFPLSNPTSKTEAQPEDLLRWSGGRALIATGSPFDPVSVAGGPPQPIAQANNALVFPGLGLGAILSRAARMTDGMLLAAAEALRDATSEEALCEGALFPPVSQLREVSAQVAAAVMRQAATDGVAGADLPADLETAVRAARYEPVYRPYSAA